MVDTAFSFAVVVKSVAAAEANFTWKRMKGLFFGRFVSWNRDCVVRLRVWRIHYDGEDTTWKATKYAGLLKISVHHEPEFEIREEQYEQSTSSMITSVVRSDTI